LTYDNIPLSTVTNGKVSQIKNGTALGYDGTLYLSTDKGLIALSANPQLKARWKYDIDETKERTGLVSLSFDESKAYFIDVKTWPESAVSRLVVLDNADGTVLSTSDYVLGRYADQTGLNYYIRAPVVQGNNVFVLNGFDNAEKLFVFNITNDQIGSTDIITAPVQGKWIS
jgi:outer membrane protein assembly factor BamB